MEKLAIIMTSEYPFGKSEFFFANELPYLLRHFDKIAILTRNRDGTQPRPVPDGVEVHRFTRLGLAGRLRYFCVPFLKEFWRELVVLRRGGEAKLSISLVRNLISFIVHGLHMRRILEQILAQHGKLQNGEGVVLYAYWMEFPVYAALRLKQADPALKVICRAHGCDLYWERHPFPYLPLRTYIADHIDAAYFISEQGLDYFMRKNHVRNPGQLKLARLGVKAGKSVAKASSDGVFRVLSCSYAVRVKRVDLIIRSLTLVKDFAVEWTHIGDGSELAELKSLAARLFQGCANITYEFKGFLSNEMVYDYYQSHCVDMLINLSSSEGLPVSMMEAVAFGVPVLATAVGGVPEIVNQRNGALLPLEVKPAEVARAIVKMRNLSDQETRALRENARETWRKSYDADRNYEAFTEDVLDVAGFARPGKDPAPTDAAPARSRSLTSR